MMGGGAEDGVGGREGGEGAGGAVLCIYQCTVESRGVLFERKSGHVFTFRWQFGGEK